MAKDKEKKEYKYIEVDGKRYEKIGEETTKGFVELPNEGVKIDGNKVTFKLKIDPSNVKKNVHTEETEKNGEYLTKTITDSILKAGYDEEIKKEIYKKETKVKPIGKMMIPILISVLLGSIGLMRGCQADKVPVTNTNPKVYSQMKEESQIENEEKNQAPNEFTIEEDMEFTFYNVDIPHIVMEGVTNAAGQEGLTGNLKEGNTFSGSHYNDVNQFENEQQASSGHQDYLKMQEELKECVEIIAGSGSQSEKVEAAKKALNISEDMKSIYTDNKEFVEGQATAFKESSEAFHDSNTNSEIGVINLTVKEYMDNMGLIDKNISMFEKIIDLDSRGYTFTISGKENTRGDLVFSGNALKTIIANVPASEELAVENELVNTQEKDFQNTQEKDSGMEIG